MIPPLYRLTLIAASIMVSMFFAPAQAVKTNHQKPANDNIDVIAYTISRTPIIYVI